jgi:glutaredoxin
MVKKYLDSKQHTYTVVNLDEAPDQIPVVEELSGGRAVPVTVIEDGDKKDIIRGWNPGQLNAALGLSV